jgi:hypothetical protein
MRPTDHNIFEITDESPREDGPTAVAELGDWFLPADFEYSGSGTDDRLNRAGAPKRSLAATGRKARQKGLVVSVLSAGVAILGLFLLSDAGGPRSRSRADVGPERPAADRSGRRTAVSAYRRGRRDRTALATAPSRFQRTLVERSNGPAPSLRRNGRGSSRSASIREPSPEVSAGLSPELVIWHSTSPTGGEGNEFSFER